MGLFITKVKSIFYVRPKCFLIFPTEHFRITFGQWRMRSSLFSPRLFVVGCGVMLWGVVGVMLWGDVGVWWGDVVEWCWSGVWVMLWDGVGVVLWRDLVECWRVIREVVCCGCGVMLCSDVEVMLLWLESSLRGDLHQKKIHRERNN
jgi:hypothetical protein